MDEIDCQPSTAGATPDMYALPDSLSESLHNACQQIIAGRAASRQIAEMVRPFALSEAEFRLLWQLYSYHSRGNLVTPPSPTLKGKTIHGPSRDQTSIRTDLAMSAAQISALVERLRTLGWLAREVDPRDRRRQLLQLTRPGITLVEKILSQMATSHIWWKSARPSAPNKSETRAGAA